MDGNAGPFALFFKKSSSNNRIAFPTATMVLAAWVDKLTEIQATFHSSHILQVILNVLQGHKKVMGLCLPASEINAMLTMTETKITH